MISLSPSTPGASSFGSGPSTGMATGRTANFGYGSLAGNGERAGGLRGPMAMGPKSVGAPIQLAPDQPIGMQSAAAPAAQQKSGGGGGGLLSRGLSFIKGIGEGGGAAEGAAGGAEAAGGADAIAELAPLALAAV